MSHCQNLFLEMLCLTPSQITFEDDLKITEMISGDGETVPFQEELYPKGNVEDWLLEVERVMRESLRKILERALKDYTEVSAHSHLMQGECSVGI